MTDGARIPWEIAKHAADLALAELAPYCERIEIAGSLRRHRPDVKDIELLAIPRMALRPTEQHNLFEPPLKVPTDLLAKYLKRAVISGYPWSLRLSKAGHPAFGPLNKLLLYKTPGREIPLDLFTATAQNWGRDMWVRTGPARWNQATATRALRMGMKFHAYGPAAFTRDGLPVTCATEEEFATVLGIACTPPEQRTDKTARTL